MKYFYILVVEDEQDNLEKLVGLLTRDFAQFTDAGSELVVRTATNQDEAESAIARSPERGFDLIILDLRYPLRSGDLELDFHGLDWLPHLRQKQPDAAIVVMSAYGYEEFLARAVRALRDGRADEFIPKNMPWAEMLLRLREALAGASQRRDLRLAARIASRPMKSQIARPAAEDMMSAVESVRSGLLRISEEIESEGELAIATLPSEIRGELAALDHKLTSIAATLAGPQDETAVPIDVGKLALDLGGIFSLQLRERGGTIETIVEGDDLLALTYRDDLSIALKEVLQNGVFAALGGATVRPTVEVIVRRSDKYVSIAVTDTGSGFADDALNHMFEPGSSRWPDGDPKQHAGMGLHIARRMMFSIGGDLMAENVGGHARVTLLVRDWALA